MSGTIAASINHGVTLTSPTYSSPVTITGAIDAGGGTGLFAATSWTIVNDGNIFAASGEGVFLKAGGVIDNTGMIQAPAAYAIMSNGVPLSVVNSGYIEGGTAGILLMGSSIALDNQAGGTIAGGTGAESVKFGGSGIIGSGLINAGLIASSDSGANGGAGLYLVFAGATNMSGGVIAGGSVGVKIANPSNFENFGVVTGETGISIGVGQNNVTITDGGTITGGLDAISFAGGNSGETLVLLPGAVLNGLAVGGGGDVVFGGTSVGTMANVGHELTLFSTVSVDSGATWNFSGTSSLSGQTNLDNNGTLVESIGDTLAVNSAVMGSGTVDLAGGTISFDNNIGSGQVIDFSAPRSELIFSASRSFSGTIANFKQDETIEISGFGINQVLTSTQSSNVLTLSAVGVTPITLTFASDPGSLAIEPVVSGTSRSYDIVMPCFRAGTRLLTPQGPRAVELLTKGDLVVTHDGAIRPIVWHGQRWVDCDRHPNPEAVLPIRVEEGAFGPGVPSRDLYVSPDHAIYCDHVLIPAKYLINGVSIRQIDVPEVVYHHIELETHDVVWAETLPAETYLDCGNRHNFSRQKDAVTLHADFASPQWDAERAYAPLVLGGPTLTAVRKRLHERLNDQGIRRVAGSFAVYADGRRLEAIDEESGQKLFRLPANARCMILDSSAACPADLDPTSFDRRRLGIAITDVTVDGISIDEVSPRFGTGFHQPERRGRRWFRWTTGNAAFDIMGAREVAFTVQAVSPTWQVPAGGMQVLNVTQHALELH